MNKCRNKGMWIIVLVVGIVFFQGLCRDSRGEEKTSLLKVPDPLSGDNPVHPLIAQPAPQVGKLFLDARFQTRLTRVTKEKGLRHEYSRFDPFNVDQSMVLLHHPESGEFRVYRSKQVPYDGAQNFLRTIEMEEPRWDPDDPSILWGFRDFQIVKLNCRTGEMAVIKDFSKDPTIGPILKTEPDLYRITTKDEGESSQDKRFWALLLQGSKEDYRLRYVFTWDRQEDRVLGVYRLSAGDAEIDWVGMSPLGNWVLIGADPGRGEHAGLTMADRELKKFHMLSPSTAHSDVGLDVDGNEVIVMQNSQTDYIDLIPIDRETQPMRDSTDYEGTNHTPIVRLFYSSESPVGLQSGVHISCNMRGYCVVSTYIEPDKEEQNWLDRSIILVKLDPRQPQAYYVAKVHNTTGAYWEETQATITSNGSKVVWASNWDQAVGRERVFLMRMDMPEEWRTSLK